MGVYYKISKPTTKGLRDPAAVERMGKTLSKQAHETALDMRRSLDHTGHGRWYRVWDGSKYKNHHASAPGEPPTNVTRTLRRSITEVEEHREGKLTWAGVGIGGGGGAEAGAAFYWKFLEHGTRKMAPRPFIAPALERARARYQIELKKFMEK